MFMGNANKIVNTLTWLEKIFINFVSSHMHSENRIFYYLTVIF